MTPEQFEYLKTLAPPPPHWGGLGATPLSLDPRDFDIRRLPGVAEALAAGVPVAVDLTGFIRGEILNQGQTGACVAFSTAHLCSIDEVIEGQPWPSVNAPLMYSRAGGTGSNGVDSRLVLSQVLESGAPLVSGGAIHPVKSYAFVPQEPGLFTNTIKAALAAGYPVVLALLLPTDFGWRSGSGAVSQGYHQICLVGYTADGYWLFVNSWGAGWPGNSPHPGVGSILTSYVESNNFQQRYAYCYTVAGADAGPPPPPPPPPVRVTGYQPNPVPSQGQLSIQGAAFDQGSLAVTWQGQSLPILGMNPDVIATRAPQVTSTQSGPVHVTVGNGSADGPALTVTAEPTPIPIPKPDPIPIPVPPVNQRVLTGRAEGTNVASLKEGDSLSLGPGITLQITQISPNPTPNPDPNPNPNPDPNPNPSPQPGGIKVLLTTKPSQLRNTVSVIAYTTDTNGNSLPASVNGEVVGSQGTVILDGKTTHGSASPAIWAGVKRPSAWGEPCQVTVRAFGNGLSGEETKPG